MRLEASTETSGRVLEQILVEDAMHRGVLTCPLETPLREVAKMMAAYRVHAIVALEEPGDEVTDFGLWGVVSDLDLVEAAAAGDLEGTTAGGTAVTEIVTIGPRVDLREAAETMREHELTHLVVVDPARDGPIGILSTLDIARALSGGVKPPPEDAAVHVEQLMTAPVVTVPPEMSLKEVATLLVERRISGVPVIEDGTLLGVVSEGDIVAKERGVTTPAPDGLLAWIFRDDAEITAKLAARTAADAMTSPAVTIESWRSAATAAALMTDRGVNRLPVLARGRLVGIVTRADLVRAFARTDAAIERDIRDEVVMRSFWMSPEGLRVRVLDGAVTLEGEVENELVAEMLPREAQRVPGVISVHSELTVAPSRKRDRPAHQRFSTPA
ncbi:MAG TPA: CBS domain-containing protein [Gaiellaceae bacterium]|nr:CBS domain-containing protein [Gaiellaceae bacterium]